MDAKEAQKVIEYFRKGIPPIGYVNDLTVGRKDEIEQLKDHLKNGKAEAILLKANYGSGKTHLLQYIREFAKNNGYAVSSVTLDAKSAIRFNRMDQILGSILSGLEVPQINSKKGIRNFFDFLCEQINDKHNLSSKNYWKKLSNNGKWDFSEVLKSPALYVAVRAWLFGDEQTKDFIEDWMSAPWRFYSQRKPLYTTLVEKLRKHFRDRRWDWQFYSDGVFIFNLQGYVQSWDCLKDIDELVKKSGLNGLIILFDEFEDILENLKNIGHQQSAFWNLFQFYSCNKFSGKSFFAVTPSFVEKCKDRLISKDIFDYDFEQFDRIKTFEMSPLTSNELNVLAKKILFIHGTAYRWEPDSIMKNKELKDIVNKAAAVQIQDRARHTIKSVVEKLDDIYQEL
jgi:hypothetical protein